jgi:plastocyanin
MKSALVLLLLTAAPKGSRPDAGAPAPYESSPLQLTVKTPEDLAYKAMVERQYLLVNLLSAGKGDFDVGDWEGAASRWEAVLRLPNLPQDVEATVKAFAKVARERAGGQAASLPALAVEPQVTITPMEPEPAAKATSSNVMVSGVVAGGGTHGPGGAVIIFRKAEGSTPKPRAARVRALLQKDKRFIPHVLAVPLGATVEFRNDDDFFHNVFSISKPNDFDLGFYKSGASREQVFAAPGPVSLLCNIHTSMNGWVYVSDSPWFGQADVQGRFTVKNVPPGKYVVEVWHEWAANKSEQAVKVVAGMTELALTVDGDRRPPPFVLDKAGKPRQQQLGY